LLIIFRIFIVDDPLFYQVTTLIINILV
jgi:hypothetical protein